MLAVALAAAWVPGAPRHPDRSASSAATGMSCIKFAGRSSGGTSSRESTRTPAARAAPRSTGSNGGPEDRERRRAEVAHQRADDEMLDRPAHDVDRDRVRADHEQRERPAAPALPLDRRVEPGEHAGSRGRRCRACTTRSRCASRSGRCAATAATRPASVSATPATTRPLQLLRRSSAALFSHSPAHMPEHHRRERRDEAQRGPAALVEAERRLAREQVQEPDVERPRQVRVLVEVREEAAYRGAASPRARRPACSRSPGPGSGYSTNAAQNADEDRREHRDLHAQRREREQEQERVAEADLRQRVLERPVGAAGARASAGRCRAGSARRCARRRARACAGSSRLARGGWRSRTAARRRRGTRTRAESDRAASSPATARASC